MDTKNMMNEQMLDDAACDALGAHTTAESAAYQRQLAGADDAAKAADRQLRETVAAMAGASPYMMPPEDLRGRILEATAPKTFKMDDYRKTTRDDSRFYRWGFVAATLFLALGALYNIYVGRQLDVSNSRLQQAAKVVNELQSENRQIIAQAQAQNVLMTALANPNKAELSFKDDSGHVLGRAIVDGARRNAVLIFPSELMPAGAQPQLSLKINDENVAFQTITITAPAVQLGMTLPGTRIDLARALSNPTITPEEANKLNQVSPVPAGMRP